MQTVVLKVDGYQFFDAYLEDWEGSPVKYSLYVKSGGVNPSFNAIVV